MTIDHILRFLLFPVLLLPLVSRSQQYADTIPANKNAVIEEFTGVKCGYCPAGHLLLDSIMNENPGRVIAIGMHPANTPLTAPYTGDPDFRRSFLNAFFSIPFATDSVRFMPGAFINRRQWADGRREQYTEHWRKYTDTIIAEPSPVNIGLHTVYDLSSEILAVTLELYYTDTLQSPHNVYVFLTEDSLIAQQNNGGTFYRHDHVFRESLTAQWGDTVISNSLPGTLYTANFNFNNTTTLYDMPHCRVIAMLRNVANEEIISGNWTIVDNFITSVAGNRNSGNIVLSVYPNPSKGIFNLTIASELEAGTIFIFNMNGQLIKKMSVCGSHEIQVDLSALPSGIYFLEIVSVKNTSRLFLIKK
jgi:hypothetical protein